MPNLLDLPGDPAGIRVAVAMSGGVDSSVVAALVKRAGFDTIGLTLQLYDDGAARGRRGACCAGQDIHDARRTAELIGIPHYVLDYESRFRTAVIDRFANSYLTGETPIPCVECNRSVKFTDLLAMARALGAAVLATGHYVEDREVGGRRALFRASDEARDQSYFLYATTPEQLAHLRFPLGRFPKAETRRLAHDMGLAVADKPDSQDICFVPDGRYADLVRRLRPEAARAGEIVALDGRVLGRHDGVANFTVGQRRGLGIASPEPLYVVALDAESARVTVGPRPALATFRLGLCDANWLDASGPESWPAEGRPCAVKVRSTRPAADARLFHRDGAVEVELATPEEGVAPGQACVVYDGSGPRARLLGGGTIARRARVPAPDTVAAAAAFAA